MNTQQPSTVHVSREALPITCPQEKSKWDLHPRVYLPVPEGASKISCPYCGTLYIIVDDPENVKQRKGKEQKG